MFELTGKIALVTGAAQGIGRGISEALARQGATVVLADIQEEKAAEAAREIGGNAWAVRVDVTDSASVRSMVDAVQRRHNRLDIVVNNAGWDRIAPFLEFDEAEWDKVLRINLYGPLYVLKAALPLMVAQQSGSVVNIGSDAGRVGSSGEAVYSAAKGGVIAITKTLARELARYGITVNAVCPGPADTPLFAEVRRQNPRLAEALVRAIPLRRLARPSDIAAAVAFLVSDEASYITGQTLSVSGGLTMV
ncbi:MAG: 3-oxoacyl-ACP reductase FabG [Actinomycetia bacterium]|nr:3-oxoacyl-ACP reductase FabG [Actinomycetes bacterium]